MIELLERSALIVGAAAQAELRRVLTGDLDPPPDDDGDEAAHDAELAALLDAPPVAPLEAEEPRREAATGRSALGLSAAQRYATRQRALRAAALGYSRRAAVHYTQRGERWDGIAHRRHALYGGYPRYADCSAFTSWCLWDATRLYGLGDFVNGAGWTAGFTGTQVRHGVAVRLGSLLVGDLVFYGGTRSRPSHVAFYAGRGRVISHGQESGPLLLPVRYRAVNQCRRYVR